MLHLPLLLLFFLILKMCHLLSDSNLELCMKDVDQLCHFLRLTHHLILFLRLLLSLLLISLLFATLREYLILLISMVFLLLYPLLLFHHVTHKLSNMSVGRKPCKRNFKLFRIIIHRILFLFLQLLSPLGVNKYSIKLRSDRTLDRYKTRLVALGNKQEYGVDYEETFASIAKMTTMHIIIAIAASQG
ncbi:hypothetical protein Peur_011869 [Populus x canadensis]